MAAAAAPALWPRINVSLQAVAQILLVIGLGVWLSLRRNLDRKALAAVSSVNWHALIPALMFSSIVGAVTPSNLLQLWPLLVLSLVHVVMGLVPALLLCWALRLPKDMSFFAVMAASLPNCGNLPWLFMPTLIRFFTPAADQVVGQIQYSTGLTSVYTIMVVVITLTVPFLFKKPPETLVLPRISSTISLGGQEDEEEREADVLARQQQHQQQHQQQQPDKQQQQRHIDADEDDGRPVPATDLHQHHDHHQQQHQLQRQPDSSDDQRHSSDQVTHVGRHQTQQQLKLQQAAPSNGATAWVVPASTDTTKPSDTAAAPPPLLPSNDSAADDSRMAAQDRPGPFELLQLGARSGALDQQQQHQHHLQQQQPYSELQPPGGRLDSFTSHRSSSFLLTHSRQLFGSFSRSFSRGVNRGLRRSASFVQLVWQYPTGWQPQRAGATGAHRRRAGAATGRRPAWLQRVCSLWASFLAHPVVNLPLGATAVGLACAAVGPVRGLLVTELAPLHWLWLGLSWVGTAAAPLATMQIGAELMQTAPVDDSMHVSRRVQWTATAIAIVVKLIVVPLANVALLRLGGLASLVPASDSVYQLLMLVEATVPAAVTLLVVCSRVYPDIRPLSSMLFWQYVVSLFTLPAFLVWYLYMLEL